MKVVGIHGIAQDFVGSPQLENAWLPALQGSLELIEQPRLTRSEFGMVFYGDLFRPSGMRSAGVPKLTARDVETEWEQALLVEWWRAAAELSIANRSAGDPLGEDPSIQEPEFQGRGRTPEIVQRALRQLSKSRFFRNLGPEKTLIFALKQVGLFLHDSDTKKAVLERVEAKVSPTETKVVIAHSLGSVVAYEALCAHPEWNVQTLVTLGSPLGIPNLIFDKLTPPPENRKGAWPNIKQWFNIADSGDIVALQKSLAPYFGDGDDRKIVDRLVYNGWQSHSVERYLTAKETGAAVATGLIV